MTPEQIGDICDELASGKSLRQICREQGMAESSVRYWLNRDEAAFAQTAHARELGCDAIADQCIEIADDEELEPADRRVRIETRIKLLGKWSQRYGEKVTVNSNATVTHKHDFSSLETGELEQLEAILAKSELRPGGVGEQEPSSVH